VAVYDRWHKDPEEGDVPCRCGKGRNRLYPSADHEKGDRWQVRWRDPSTGKQKKRSFALRDPGPGELPDPEKHASAHDKAVQGSIVTRTYKDPNAGQVTLTEYAEAWRKARRLKPRQAARIERMFRLHVYEDPARPGSAKTPKGGVAIGQYPMGVLAARPSLVAGWAAAIPLAPGPARQVMGRVSKVFRVAMEDGAAQRDPTRLEAVDWPEAGPTKARAWSLAQIEAMRAALPERWRVMLDIGAGCGLRQGEMLGLGVDDVDWLKRDDPRVRVVRQLQHAGGRAVFAPVKNRTPHEPPLPQSVKEQIARHLERFPAVTVTLPWDDPDDRERHGQMVTVRLILTSPGGTPAWGTTLSNTWNAAARRAKVTPDGGRVRDDGCHALRHTFVSTQLRARTDIVRVADWIGDTVEMVAKTYAHMLPGRDDDDGRAAVDAFFAGPVPDSGCARNVPGETADQAP
jgi:integrase